MAFFARSPEIRDTTDVLRGSADEPTLFGSIVQCANSTVGDGRVDAFDLAVLTWIIFRHTPYGDISLNIQTVHTRNGTAFRCDDDVTTQQYALQLEENFCSAGQPQSQPRAPLQPPWRCLTAVVEPWSVTLEAGNWSRIRFFENARVDDDKFVYALQLFLVGVGNALATLDELTPPERGCTGSSCAPSQAPDQVHVRVSRREDLEMSESYAGSCDTSSSPVFSAFFMRGRYAIGGSGTLSIVQDTPASACPIDVYIWVPAVLRNGLTLNSSVSEPCGGAVGVLPGSMAMDGLTGAVQCTLACSNEEGDRQGLLPISENGGISWALVFVLVATLLFVCCMLVAFVLFLRGRISLRETKASRVEDGAGANVHSGVGTPVDYRA